MRALLAAAAGGLLSWSSSMLAAPATPLAHADALQPPVWVERDGHRLALAPGAALQAGDGIETGAGGHLHIALADASIVKLGERASFRLPVLATADAGDASVLKAALQVLKGAFRFTTTALGKLHRREIDVRIGPTITAGIRGTDIWGKSDGAQDLLCLIEGRIEVSSPGAPGRSMSDPGTFYVVPRRQLPRPVAPAPAAKLREWVPQTELLPDEPAQYAAGRYRVELSTHADQATARAAMAKFSDQGYAAEVTAAGGRYAVQMRGFASAGEAERFARRAPQRLQASEARVLPPG